MLTSISMFKFIISFSIGLLSTLHIVQEKDLILAF